MIGIINYGSGNVQAIANIYNRTNFPYKIIHEPEQLKSVDKLILPGVGDFDETIKVLDSSGLRNSLNDEVLVKKKLVLGICVGMQILSDDSEEGIQKGLGWIKGNVKKFDILKIKQKPFIPHMGWNNVEPKISHDLFKNIDIELGFYFVHSFYFNTFNSNNILATTFYGEEFTSAVFNENIFGVQFHPEKSHSNGIQLLSNFARI
ncbi:MAG: imidazole glycerol phosphate synthase subunit HisH [Bacteroidia bacterium]|nr:imidazole glycerol phosphate synthase subunit HisH [Bacteroidia bacterium]